MTFRQWNDRACCLANALSGLGLGKGDRVAVLAHNRVEVRAAPTGFPPVGNALGPPIYPAGGPYYPSSFAAANGLSAMPLTDNAMV